MASSADSSSKGKDVDEGNVFEAPDCPVEKVTVYADRAEVCRRVETSLVAGQNQVVIRKLPLHVDQDSIRVEGKGAATISEVSFQSKHVPPNEAERSQRSKELREELDALELQETELLSEQAVLKKQWELLDSFANSASRTSLSEKDGETSKGIKLEESFFKSLTDFLQLYNKEGNALEKKLIDLKRKLALLGVKKEAISRNLRELSAVNHSNSTLQQCVIVLECAQATKVSLLVSYVTSCASWTPSYDIRMFTADNLLKITYYGLIKQSTGEDWNNAKLFLSTASPSIGGEVPELGTAELSVQQPTQLRKAGGFGGRAFKPMAMYSPPPPPMAEALYSAEPVGNLLDYVVPVTALVGESVATTVYEIVRPATIPSDNIEHKVTVGLIDIKPTICYTCVPKRVPQAYMIAKVVNGSAYTFLRGETSIFLDNTFVSKGSMKDVFPQEEFECSLGIDPAIKVTYKPLKKYKTASGIFSKVTSTTYEQVTEVKNTHDYGVKLLVMDQLPRSTDERVKVNLLEPQIDLKHLEKNKDVTLNKKNNIEWNVDLPEKGTKELVLKYVIEHPSQMNLQTAENFGNA
ncbi:hypothetical protein C0Q70_10717 [Pomacea canaliculata]|uniref:DUF4139 domain-containing protein n=1 Tax=Pomacea canaliculata TaxID=400727 RepID=A0A2T7P404_POMCA|nr:protein F37C4.5-like isoform X2 [Pomacea canaliculata]PVD28133.1 hypothetical protein C0Q70_10717 [Pomacea canaliculata]